MLSFIRSLLGSIVLALSAVRRNVLRASLTVLGILIGIAAVVVVTALGTGARDSVANQIQAIGSNFIIVFPQTANASGARGAAGSGARLTEDDGRVIAREAVSVLAVAPALRTRAQVIAGERNRSTSIIGTTLPYYTVRNWGFAKGAAWQLADETSKAKVCVLGMTVANDLFGNEDPIGRSIRIDRHSYRVVGVLEVKGEAPFGGDQDDTVVLPIGSFRGRVMKTPPGFAGTLMISATSAETTDRAVAQIDSILRQRHRIDTKEPDFQIRTQKEFQAIQGLIYGVLTLLLVVVAAISLVVGGIGVMNIMLVSVTERTREIGIRMAIGAQESDIQMQFLVEAVVLATLGGIAGILLGSGAISILARILEWKMAPDPIALSVSLAVSAAIGVGFGFFPARRAAKLDPIVALRRE